jgi:hypothetical protein
MFFIIHIINILPTEDYSRRVPELYFSYEFPDKVGANFLFFVFQLFYLLAWPSIGDYFPINVCSFDDW